MTIFIEVLKKLIREPLMDVAAEQIRKSTATGHDHSLSLAQKNILLELDENLVRFQSSNNDAVDVEKIKALLDASRAKIQGERERHKKSVTQSTTITALNTLMANTTDFYKKIVAFQELGENSFSLLDRLFVKRPDSIAYFAACYYLGQEIFSPHSHSTPDIRTRKEMALASRLKLLSQLIPSGHTLSFKEQVDRTLSVLNIILEDNRKIVESARYTLQIPGFSMSFFGVTTSLPTATAGRLESLIEQAKVDLLILASLEPATAAPLGQLKEESSDVVVDESAEVVSLGQPGL